MLNNKVYSLNNRNKPEIKIKNNVMYIVLIYVYVLYIRTVYKECMFYKTLLPKMNV
jgi:hypothetical protein